MRSGSVAARKRLADRVGGDADVARWHVGLGDTPGAANRALAIRSSMLGWAVEQGLREAANPAVT